MKFLILGAFLLSLSTLALTESKSAYYDGGLSDDHKERQREGFGFFGNGGDPFGVGGNIIEQIRKYVLIFVKWVMHHFSMIQKDLATIREQLDDFINNTANNATTDQPELTSETESQTEEDTEAHTEEDTEEQPEEDTEVAGDEGATTEFDPENARSRVQAKHLKAHAKSKSHGSKNKSKSSKSKSSKSHHSKNKSKSSKSKSKSQKSHGKGHSKQGKSHQNKKQ